MQDIEITDEVLTSIYNYASYNIYKLSKILELCKIPQKLSKNEKIQKSYEDGLINKYLIMSSDGFSDEDIVKFDFSITLEQCQLWTIKYKKILQDAKKKEVTKKSKEFVNPLLTVTANLAKTKKVFGDISENVMADEIATMVTKMQGGDTSDILNILLSNTLQLQNLNTKITTNIVGDIGKKLDSFDTLSKLQLKTMAETRKNIIAMNEICNPKRTTFIKEANQYNQLNQKNSQKKLKTENELQKPQQLVSSTEVKTEHIMPIKEYVK